MVNTWPKKTMFKMFTLPIFLSPGVAQSSPKASLDLGITMGFIKNMGNKPWNTEKKHEFSSHQMISNGLVLYIEHIL